MAKKRTQARRKGSTSRSRSGTTRRARSGGRKSSRVSGGKAQTVRIVIEQPYSPFGPAVAGASVTPAKARF